MADANVYLRVLGELGIDTGQLAAKSDHAGRILRDRDGQRVPGLYINRQGGTSYFSINPGVATVELDWGLWQEAPPGVAVPFFDRDKHNVIPRPGQERPALRNLLGLPAEKGFLSSLKSWFARPGGR